VDVWWSPEHRQEFRELEPDWIHYESKDIKGFLPLKIPAIFMIFFIQSRNTFEKNVIRLNGSWKR